MSDDESFVIMGSSPPSQNSIEIEKEIPESKNLLAHPDENSQHEANVKTFEIVNNSNSIINESSINSKSLVSNNAMAASYLLGDLGEEVLKESVYSQFPSLNTSLKSKEDFEKLQSLITSNIDLKETLRTTNETVSNWMIITKNNMDDLKSQLQKCQEETQLLRKDNHLLQKQLNEKIQHIELMEKIRTQENDQLRMGISEKSALILNMQQHILKLEEQQLKSYDFLKETQSLNCENGYVPITEHKTTIEKFEAKMSTITAENLEIKDMQSQYVDEINCLKVNLCSFEELYKKAKLDIQILQNNEMTKSTEINEYKNKIESIKEELSVLRIQVDTYQKDFESERSSRQNMAGERDNLLLELKKLQTNNQKLIEEIELNSRNKKSNGQIKKTTKPITPVNELSHVYERVVYSCPLCGIEHKTLGGLQNHVQACLDENN